jgi:hypothetical protein
VLAKGTPGLAGAELQILLTKLLFLLQERTRKKFND